jgi:hypothetical protein
MEGTTNFSYLAANKESSMEEDLAAVAAIDGADFAAADKHSIQSIRRTAREATMDFWRILLAISQVAAANEILFDKVESAPMGRFHSIGQVFPDALYGHIIIRKRFHTGGRERRQSTGTCTTYSRRTWWRATMSLRPT